MAKITFDSRLICDISFYNKNMKNNFMVLRQLMYININSKEHPRNHVVISKKNFDYILKENPNAEKYSDVIRAYLKPIDEPAIFESVTDEITRNIYYAIILSSIPPYRTIILTTSERINDYKSNKHYSKMKYVTSVFDKDALNIIQSYFDECMNKEKY